MAALRGSVVVAAFAAAADGCGFSGMGGPMPANHPNIDEQGERAQFSWAIAFSTDLEDLRDGFASPGLSPRRSPRMIDFIDALAKEQGEDQCYWAWQALPHPEPSDAADANGTRLVEEARAAQRLGQAFNARCQALYSSAQAEADSIWEGCLVSYGAELNAALCDVGDFSGAQCSDAVLGSRARAPFVSAIARLTGSNAAAAKTQVWDWLEDPGAHLASAGAPPSSTSPRRAAALLTAKVVPCGDIPERFKQTVGDPDRPSAANRSMTLVDDALEVWAGLRNECSHCEGEFLRLREEGRSGSSMAYQVAGMWLFIGAFHIRRAWNKEEDVSAEKKAE
uniref:Uncharacterized protein n=1 Tax=Zooxanthella nutricula TaxID=1333877 RepID=A0A6V0G155_9DINO|mmetsp:Transcript_88577/g.271140  ORF Transcript_88577/g.271140 Transcript_88577/m.271140 type:complete len:337 (+) Transcript_88577:99-1109(+)